MSDLSAEDAAVSAAAPEVVNRRSERLRKRLGGSTSVPADLFPLPLAPFERLMFLDDWPTMSRAFRVTMELEGELDPQAFRRAVNVMVARHPLLAACVRRERGGMHWEPVPFPEDFCRWSPRIQVFPERSLENVDLTREPGFRVWGMTEGGRTRIELQFHHAACDGQGSRRAVIDLATAYALEVDPQASVAPLDPLDYERLRARANYVRKGETSVGPELTLGQRVQTSLTFLKSQPVPLRAPAEKRPPQGGPHLFETQIGGSLAGQAYEAARDLGVTVNDLAVAILLETIARWNRDHGERGSDKLYRILVPVDLREREDELLPASNRMSFVFITRPTSLCLDWRALVDTVRAEMAHIRKFGHSYDLVQILPGAMQIPLLTQAMLRMPLCLSTAVLTNLGDPSRGMRRRFPQADGKPILGNLRFLRVSGAPPIRPKMSAGFGLTTDRQEIAVSGMFDAKVLGPNAANELFARFLSGWNRWSK